MSDESLRQATNVVPPRRGAVIALSVDSTARAYDITGISLGKAYDTNRAQDYVFVRLEAQTNDIFYHFHSASATDLADTSTISAGGSIAFNDAYGARIVKDTFVDLRIEKATDKYLVVKCASGNTATLRFYANSQPSP